MNPSDFTKSLLARVATSLDTDGDDPELQNDLTVLIAAFEKAYTEPEGAITLIKADDDQRMVWGWALVSVEKGDEVVDLQGDVVDTSELQRAVHESFMPHRIGKRMHAQQRAVGTVVDSIVFTKALQDALGIDLGREGWFVGMKITKDDVWQEVKSGRLAAFSIGGEGERHPVTKNKDAKGHGSNPGYAQAHTDAAVKASRHAVSVNTSDAHYSARNAHDSAAKSFSGLKAGKERAQFHLDRVKAHHAKAEALRAQENYAREDAHDDPHGLGIIKDAKPMMFDDLMKADRPGQAHGPGGRYLPKGGGTGPTGNFGPTASGTTLGPTGSMGPAEANKIIDRRNARMTAMQTHEAKITAGHNRAASLSAQYGAAEKSGHLPNAKDHNKYVYPTYAHLYEAEDTAYGHGNLHASNAALGRAHAQMDQAESHLKFVTQSRVSRTAATQAEVHASINRAMKKSALMFDDLMKNKDAKGHGSNPHSTTGIRNPRAGGQERGVNWDRTQAQDHASTLSASAEKATAQAHVSRSSARSGRKSSALAHSKAAAAHGAAAKAHQMSGHAGNEQSYHETMVHYHNARAGAWSKTSIGKKAPDIHAAKYMRGLLDTTTQRAEGVSQRFMAAQAAGQVPDAKAHAKHVVPALNHIKDAHVAARTGDHQKAQQSLDAARGCLDGAEHELKFTYGEEDGGKVKKALMFSDIMKFWSDAARAAAIAARQAHAGGNQNAVHLHNKAANAASKQARGFVASGGAMKPKQAAHHASAQAHAASSHALSTNHPLDHKAAQAAHDHAGNLHSALGRTEHSLAHRSLAGMHQQSFNSLSRAH